MAASEEVTYETRQATLSSRAFQIVFAAVTLLTPS